MKPKLAFTASLISTILLISIYMLRSADFAVAERSLGPAMDGNLIGVWSRMYLPLFWKNSSYFDDFENPDSGWSQENNDSFSSAYDHGEYIIHIKKAFVWAEGMPKSQLHCTDCAIEVTGRFASERVNGAYGMAFAMHDNGKGQRNGYFLLVCGDGRYALLKLVNGGWGTPVVPFTQSSYINKQTTNQVRVRRIGNDIELYANGTLLTSAADPSYRGDFGVGLVAISYGDGDLEIRFDDFSLAFFYSPTPTVTPTPTSSPTPTATSTPTPTQTSALQKVVIVKGEETHGRVEDTYISSWYPEKPFHTASKLIVRSSNEQVSLIRFNADLIPPNATIVSATLQIHIYETLGTYPMTIGVYNVITDWVQNEANWYYARDGRIWETPGCAGAGKDFDSNPIFSTTLNMSESYNLSVTEAVSKWVSSPQTNRGLLLRAISANQNTEWSFCSSECSIFTPPVFSERPKLTILFRR